jgi:hypothetical protein
MMSSNFYCPLFIQFISVVYLLKVDKLTRDEVEIMATNGSCNDLCSIITYRRDEKTVEENSS